MATVLDPVRSSVRNAIALVMLVSVAAAFAGEEKPAAEQKPAADGESGGETKPEAVKPTTLGVGKPSVRDILWTAYFITPVERAPEGEGRALDVTSLQGKKFRYHVTASSFRRAEMEGVVVGVDKEGEEHFAYRIGTGKWRELPEGSQGMGNRMNPLSAFRHIAADQSIFRYGSMVHVEEAEGVTFEGHGAIDGYFWIADTGGRIDGNHFDLFVGEKEMYTDFLHHEKRKKRYKTSIYRLPDSPEGMNPRTVSGLTAILRGKGFLDGEDKPGDEELHDALVEFQKTVDFIPKAEHGSHKSAVTLWFLMQAAHELKAAAAEEE